jgi:hypothetical protein
LISDGGDLAHAKSRTPPPTDFIPNDIVMHQPTWITDRATPESRRLQQSHSDRAFQILLISTVEGQTSPEIGKPSYVSSSNEIGVHDC